MDLIEVDPKLFVTCRLCLEDTGQFQLAPLVLEQINYCFDIQVGLFDGLPQLICVKCKNILHNFYNIKKTYTEKQINLKEKLLKKQELCVEPQQDTVSSSQPITDTEEDTVRVKHKKRKRILESSSDSECEKSPRTTPPPTRASTYLEEPEADYNDGKPVIEESEYQKRMVCMMCNSTRVHERDMIYHLRTHNHIRSKYKDIFNKSCTVQLQKFDADPNAIGSNHMVVHNSNKIIKTTNEHYYVLYTRKNNSPKNKKNIDKTITTTLEVILSKQESIGKKENVVKAKHKKRRLLSRSSNETVVIETESNKVISDNDEDTRSALSAAEDTNEQTINKELCINIDDSSDNDSDREKSEITQRIKEPMEAELGDYKVIQGIISMCTTSFLKKLEAVEADPFLNTQNKKLYKNLHSQLKHKILSIGRKIINKQGFNCTGLLRYMEHKNLQIMWMIKQLSYSNKETNYIRILTKLRGLESDDTVGWEKASMYSSSENDSTMSYNDKNAAEASTVTKVEIVQAPQQIEQVALTSSDNTNCNGNDVKKLLNANPVANPKQLPKKVSPGNELKPNKLVLQQTVAQSTNDDNNGFSGGMPIITSTTSLAATSNAADNQGDKQNATAGEVAPVVPEKTAPRIKVKPVTELMSERALNSLSTEQASSVANSNMLTHQITNVWPLQQALYVPNNTQSTQSLQITNNQVQLVPSFSINPTYQVVPCTQISNQQSQLVPATTSISVTPTYPATSTQSTPAVQTSVSRDAVILDSVELPRQRTDCPFKYLKDLLQIHNVILLNPGDTVNHEFICLIKFRVSFEQDTTAESVVICLTMLCHKNVFCIKVRDVNQKDIDIHKLTANWQWVLLRSFTGNVATKMLNTAQKIGRETFDHTNKFCSILNSIKFDKVT